VPPILANPPAAIAQDPVPPVVVTAPSAIRDFLRQRGSGRLADNSFAAVMLLCACSIFAIVLFIFGILVIHSRLSLAAFGWSFFTRQAWDPVSGDFGALPFIYGTLATSLVYVAVPLALGVAMFLTELCPRRSGTSFSRNSRRHPKRRLWSGPSCPCPAHARVVGPFLVNPGLDWILLRPKLRRWFLTASIILAIMILPIISSLTRDIMTAVPNSQREAVLALGATRWEMIRIGVLRNSRIGIVGAIMLGLGRALGKTMAVTMVIGNHPNIGKSLFAPANTLASVIAGEFSEATGDLYLSALIEIGLALFLVTIVVNAIARLMVWAVTRNAPARVH
jgi:phosphate transport system permease protein